MSLLRSRTPLSRHEKERIYMDWLLHSNEKCNKSWYQIRAKKIIDFVALDLEARRDKLRSILDRESDANMKACKDKLKMIEISRKYDLIEEAARIKEFIKQRNAEINRRQLVEQMKLNSDEYRRQKVGQHNRTVAEDQKMINQFNAFKNAMDKEKEKKLDNMTGNFITTLNGSEEDRVDKIRKRELANAVTLKKQINEHELAKSQTEEEKKAEGILIDKEKQEMATIKIQETAEKLKKQEGVRKSLEKQIQETFAGMQLKREKNAEFEQFVGQQWQSEVKESNSNIGKAKNQRLHEINKRAQYFLDHQRQIRNHRKCEEMIRDESIKEAEILARQTKKNREVSRQEFLEKLKKEVHESRQRALHDKAEFLKAEKVRGMALRNEMVENMRIHELNQQAKMRLKQENAELVKKFLLCQMEDRRKRHEMEINEKLKEKEEYARAEKEYKDNINMIANPVSLKEFNIHPWRKKSLGYSD